MTVIEVEYGLKTLLIDQFITAASNVAKVFIPSRSNGTIVLTDPDQFWFWNDEWQEGERKVDEYIEAGNVQEFDTMEDFLLSLKE